MNYLASVEIDLPIDKVVSLFKDPENYHYWMEGLLSLELKKGVTGEVGTETLFRFKMGKREMEMMETVEVSDLPDEYAVSYKAKGVSNTVTSKFSELDGGRTLYTTENEFRFTGFMKVIAFLMPGSFKKQSQKYLNDFKDFAEKNKLNS